MNSHQGTLRPIACLAWSSAPRHLGSRDRYIGWDAEARRRNIRLIAYNTRFLILPWVRVPHLASHILGRMAAVLPEDWQRIYHHPVYFAETFIDPGRFRGTCYRAANWKLLGLTTGRGKDSTSKRPNPEGVESLCVVRCRHRCNPFRVNPIAAKIPGLSALGFVISPHSG